MEMMYIYEGRNVKINPELTNSVFEEVGYGWKEGFVNLNDYSLNQLEYFSKAGYDSLSDCIKTNGESVNQILAELIWECE